MLLPGNPTFFTITPGTVSLGPFQGEVSLPSSDLENSPFGFTIRGTVTNTAPALDNTGTMTLTPINEDNTALTWAAGDTTAKMISVTINGDTVFEPDETFYINLSTPTNATLSDSQGVGTIQNDDPFQVSRIIDNDTPGFEYHNGRKKDPWTFSRNGGYLGNFRSNSKGKGNSYATWTFSDLPPGKYDVRVMWFVKKGLALATNAPYTIDPESSGPTVPVIQRRKKPGFYSYSLGIFDVTGDTLQVKLSDKANGTVIADAVWVTWKAPLGAQIDQAHHASRTASVTTADLQNALAAAAFHGSGAAFSQRQGEPLTGANVAMAYRPDVPYGIVAPGSFGADQYAPSNELLFGPTTKEGEERLASREGANRDVNELALLAILSERTSKAKFVTRVGPRMEDGRFNDSYFLTPGQTAPDDRVRSAVFGGLANDWFFGFSPPDEVRSKGPKDR